MKKQVKVLEFEWDKGNIDKNYAKHGVTPKEMEEIFLDEKLVIVLDIEHSKAEERLIAIGKNNNNKILFAVFIKRNEIIRVISARAANRKERIIYEKLKKNSTL